jgi:putative FmdB family regulatory protein
LQEKAMPTYAYLCDNCGEGFTQVMSIKEYGETRVTCPKCKSPEVKQQLTEFIAKTSRKS